MNRRCLKIACGLLGAVSGFGARAQAAWTAAGPYGGSAAIVVADPSRSGTLLAGTSNGLIYRTENGGESWHALPFPGYSTATIHAIVIDPQDPNVFYVGVAGIARNPADYNGAGVFRTRDAGAHWERLPYIQGHSVFSLAVWPGDSRILLAGATDGIYQTADGGATWRKISPDDNVELQAIMSLAFDPAHKETIYAGTPHLPWKTNDGGLNWQPIHAGMLDDSDVMSIQVDASRNERVFASACSGIYRSLNGGGHWTILQGIPNTGRRTHIITQDPQHPEIVYAGTTQGLWRSTDTGATWTKLNEYSINSIAFDPLESSTLYLATEAGGLLKSADRAQTLRPVNQGFVNRNITQLSMAGPVLYATTTYDGDSGGLFRSQNGGRSWSLLANHSRLLGENLIALTTTGSQVLIGASYNGLLKSSDGGRTWTALHMYQSAIAPVESNVTAKHLPVSKLTVHRSKFSAKVELATGRIYTLKSFGAKLYLGASNGLFCSDDAGATWKRLDILKTIPLSVLAIFAGGRKFDRLAALTSGALFFSEDQGRNWRPSHLPAGDISGLALPATDSRIVLAATSHGLLRSNDGGRAWTPYGEGLPPGWISSLALDPARPTVVYAIENGVIYYSGNGGKLWQPFDGSGLENASVRYLLLNGGLSGRLLAVTAAQGVYVHTLTNRASTE